MRDAVARRLVEVGLELHPDKTRIVYCKDSNRRGSYEQVSFTFCGYTFRPRKAYNKRTGKAFTGFLPAVVSGKLTAMSRRVACWRIHRRTNLTLDDLAAGDQSRAAGLVRLLHRVLPERGEPALPAHRSPSGALGEVEVQATGAQRQAGTGMAAGGPVKESRAVRALAVLRSARLAGRHEPYESRGSRADLWGPAGEIPAGYPAR